MKDLMLYSIIATRLLSLFSSVQDFHEEAELDVFGGADGFGDGDAFGRIVTGARISQKTQSQAFSQKQTLTDDGPTLDTATDVVESCMYFTCLWSLLYRFTSFDTGFEMHDLASFLKHWLRTAMLVSKHI